VAKPVLGGDRVARLEQQCAQVLGYGEFREIGKSEEPVGPAVVVVRVGIRFGQRCGLLALSLDPLDQCECLVS